MLPVIQLGPLAIRVPGLLLILGLWLGISLAERTAGKRGVDGSILNNLIFTALVAGVIGARLVYAARYASAFSASPLSLFSLNPGLLDPLGGAAVGLLAAITLAQRKNLHLLPLLDALTPLFAVVMVASASAHLASGDAFGAPTTLPWGIDLWGAKRQSYQIYEIAAYSVILAVFWPVHRRFDNWRPGTYFFSFAAVSAGASLFLGAFRGDSVLLPGGLRQEQIAAWVILAVCLAVLGRLNRKET